jgi:hypothetical protein
MASRHQRTFAAVFEDPVRANILWRDIEAMFVYLGATVTSGAGSRVRIELNGVDAVFHRPHPQKETKQRAVRNVRLFLTSVGVCP